MNRLLFRTSFLFVFVLIVWVPGTCILAQNADTKPTDVEFRIQTTDGRTQFQIGEIVPLKLSFTSSATTKYQITMASYDRSGRMQYEKFQMDTQEGWSDPLHLYFSGGIFTMGGLAGIQVLSPTPTIVPLDLNEWVRFDKPGKYSFRVVSGRVADVSNKKASTAGIGVELTSNELQITIMPPSKSWQDDTLRSAVAILDKIGQPNQPKPSETEIERAVKTLRYLGTSDSVKEMARRLGSDDSRVSQECFYGLVSANPKDAIVELQRLMSDPDYAVTTHFFFALSTLQRNPEQPPNAIMQQDVRNRDIIMEDVRAAVSRKRGKALATTLSTILEMTNRPPAKSEHMSDAMVQQIISVFDQLPIQKQAEMLESRWDLIKRPAFLPILRKYASAYTDFTVPNLTPAYYSLQLSSSALMHWYELEPDEARKAVIQEIVRPKPRYGARILGILSDETLPEVEQVLVEHLATNQESGRPENVASLINRYGTDSILPQVLAVADKHIGKWRCDIENPILAYLLRVDPESARSRLETAFGARGTENSGCYKQLVSDLGKLRQDPIVEELAIRALDEGDPEVAGNAATYLGKYGSPAAEEHLWERLSQWSEEWHGRENELSGTSGGGDVYWSERNLGTSLIRAISNAKSWTLNEDKLRRLRPLAVLPAMQHEVEDDLSVWENKTWNIQYLSFSDGKRFQVLNYEASSIKTIEEKLLQFPAGSTFMWIDLVGPADDADRVVAKELSEFLSSHGMKLTIPGSAGPGSAGVPPAWPH